MVSRSGSIYVFALLGVFFVDAQWATEDDSCRTPDREIGSCIKLTNCKPIDDILDAVSQPIPANIVNLLRSYQCGFSEGMPKVCCPSKPISINGLITTKNSDIPLPPDVSGHKNINLLPKNCGHVDTGDRIINGNKTGLFEFPWMALLSYRTFQGAQFRCGGTILNKNYILTAAHCITSISNPLLGVRVGEHDIKKPIDCEITEEGEEICAPPYQDLAIEEIIPHPDYNKNLFANDIGLLRVTPIDLNKENMRPVCLPLDKARTYNFTNKSCVITGWGTTETGRSSSVLLQAQIPLVSFTNCNNIYKDDNKIPMKSGPKPTLTFKHLCAGGNSRSDSCAGDSGGPLHVIANLHKDVRLVQQGIVSFGPKLCGQNGFPGVYTRVAYYMDWILDNIKP